MRDQKGIPNPVETYRADERNVVFQLASLFKKFAAHLTMACCALGAGAPLASAVTVDVASGEQGVATDITTGSDGLTKTGSGTLQIWSAQPYTGATVISAGQIMLAGSGAISASSALQLASGASIHLTGYYAPADINRTFAGLTGAGILYGGGGTVTINKASGSDTFSGDIQGAQGFIKSGAGTLVLSGANTYTGGTLVSAGTLQFNSGAVVAGGITNNASLVYNFTSDEGMNNTISGTGSLTKTGAGVLYLYGEGSTYTGATLINQGRLAMSGGGGGLSSNSAVQMVAGTVLDLAGPWAPASVSRTFAGLSGAGTVTGNTTGTFTINKALGSSDTFAGTIIGTVALNKAGAGTLVLSGANTYTGGTLISGGTLDLNGGSVSGGITNNANLVIRSDLANAVSGTGSLTKEGLGDAYLWTASSYTGATVINGGKLVLAGAGAIAESSAVQIASGGILDLAGPFAPNNINRTIGGLSGGGIIYGSGGTVTVNKVSGTDIFTGNIQGGQGLVKSGAGDLALGGASSYTGTTTVNAGRLVVAHGNALGGTAGGTTVANGAQLMLTNVTVGNEALTLSGIGLASGTSIAGALRSVGANTYGGKITLGADAKIFGNSGTSLTLDVASGNAVDLAAYTLNIDGAGSTQVNDGIVGTGGILKTGSGTTTFAASNSYSGATTLNAGRTVLSGSGRLGAGAITISNASTGTLEFAVTGINTMANSISGNGALLSSSGVTELNGAVTSTGGLTVNSSTVRVGNSGSVATATTVNSGGTLDVAGTADNVTVNNSGTLKGSGTVSALSIASGGTLSPGNSTGIFNAGSTTLLGGGNYDWEIDTFGGGVVGTNWDFLNITGDLTISATSGSKFIIDVISLLASSDTAGLATNFNDASNYSFAIATASGSISGYGSDVFNINTSGFQNAFTGTWGTSLSNDGKSLNLTYTAATAIPEPSTGMLFLSALSVLALRRRFSVK
jgi:autotransporter-associated beta strand protein